MKATPLFHRSALLALLRLMLAWVIVGALYYFLFRDGIVATHSRVQLVQRMFAFDLFRQLFYSLSPALMVLLFLPSNLSSKNHLFVGSILAVFLSVLPLLIFALNRAFSIVTLLLLPAFILAANILFLFIDSERLTIARTVRKTFLLPDIVVPFGRWLLDHAHLRFWRIPMRILHSVYLCILFFMALILCNSSQFPPVHFSLPTVPHSAETGKPMDAFGLALSDDRNSLWIAHLDSISRMDITALPKVKTSTLTAFPADYGGVAYFSPPIAEAKALVATIQNDYCNLTLVDRDTLTISARKQFAIPSVKSAGRTKTFYYPSRNIALALFEEALISFAPGLSELDTMQFYGHATDGILDPQQPILYAIFDRPGMLVAFHAQTLQVIKILPLSGLPQGLDLDSKQDRIFIAYPLEGLLRVVDLSSFEETESLPVLLGTRAVKIDYEHGWILSGGLAPYTEIHRLEDFRLIDRLHMPGWQRGFSMPSSKEYLFTATLNNVWLSDLSELTGKAPSIDCDPFFLLLRGFSYATRLFDSQRHPAATSMQIQKISQHATMFTNVPANTD